MNSTRSATDVPGYFSMSMRTLRTTGDSISFACAPSSFRKPAPGCRSDRLRDGALDPAFRSSTPFWTARMASSVSVPSRFRSRKVSTAARYAFLWASRAGDFSSTGQPLPLSTVSVRREITPPSRAIWKGQRVDRRHGQGDPRILQHRGVEVRVPQVLEHDVQRVAPGQVAVVGVVPDAVMLLVMHIDRVFPLILEILRAIGV
jgi:hypothetical protein